MKRLYALIVAAALCFPSIGAWAWWQSIQQVAISSGTPFGITFVSNNSNLSPGVGPTTFAAQGIGTADATRLVVVAIASQAGVGISISGVTIAGSAATQVSGAGVVATPGPLTDIWYLAVPTGATADIVISTSAAVARIAIAVYNVIGTGVSVSTGANTSSGTSVSTLAQSATIPAGGGAIGVLNVHSSTAGAVTPTNLVNDTNVVFGGSTMQSGKNTSSSGSTSMGFSWAGTAADGTLSLVTFNP